MRRREVWFWEHAPFFRVLPPLIFGILCYDRGWFDGWSHSATLFAICSLIFAFIALQFYRSIHPLIIWFRWIILSLFIFWLAILSCRINDIATHESWFGHHQDSNSVSLVRLSDAPEEKARTWKLIVEVEAVSSGVTWERVNGKALIYMYKDSLADPPGSGDLLMVPGRWRRIESSREPFAFDYSRYASRNGLHYQQFLSRSEIEIVARGCPNDFSLLTKVHLWCMQQLEHYLDDRATLGLMQAMLVGDEVNLDPELRQAYSETGIIHVVAISGGHVMMLFMIISASLFWLRDKRYQKLKYLIAIPIVWFYVLVSGAPPSAVRSVIMFSVLALGIQLGQRQNSLNQLFATAFILLCFEPMWLYSIGFQLSFIAVLSLILYYKPIMSFWSPRFRVTRFLWEAAAASIAAEILVAPLVIYYFHVFPLSFIVANVIAGILMGMVLLAGIILVLTSAIPLVATIVAFVISFVVKHFNVIIIYLQELNPESLRNLVLSPAMLCSLYLLIGGLTYFFFKRKFGGLWLGLTSACIILACWIWGEWQSLRQDRLVVYYNGGQTLVERITGKHYSWIGEVTNQPYSVAKVHTGWSAWRSSGEMVKTPVFLVNGNAALLLQEAVEFECENFPVHSLIIDYPIKASSFEQIMKVFQPRHIIICGRQYAVAVDKWRDLADDVAISLSVLREDRIIIIE